MKQRELLRAAHMKLGDLLATISLNAGIPEQEIDEISVLLKLAKTEPQSFNPVAKMLRDIAETEWPSQPTEEAIRRACALGANEINRILGVDETPVVPRTVESEE